MAEAVVGYNIAVGLETESTFGTDPGSTRNWFPYLSESVERTFETLVQEDTRGRVERNNASQGRESVSGSFDVHVDSENIGWPLLYILGTASSPSEQTTGEDDYLHTFTPDTSTLPSFVFETDYGEVAAKAKIATGCRMNSVSIDIADGLVTASCGIDAQTLDEDATPTSVTFPTRSRTFDFKDFSATIDGTDVSIDVIGGSVTFDSGNLTDDYRQGNQQIQSLPAGTLSVSASLTLAYDPSTATGVQDFLEGSVTDKDVVLTYTGDQIGAGNNHKLEITLRHCYAESSTPIVAGPGDRVERSVSLKPLHDYASDSEVVKVDLVNTVSTQYS